LQANVDTENERPLTEEDVARFPIPGPSAKRVLLGPPQVAGNSLRPLFVSTVLLGAAWQIAQLQRRYLVENAFSADARVVSAVILAPVWEESLKLGLGSFSGFVALLVSSVVRSRRRRTWALVASVSAFLATSMIFVADEIRGGGLDGTITTPLGTLFKVLGHPGFSILAVPATLEARPRASLFVGIGYGFHSTMNLIVNLFPLTWVRTVSYLLSLSAIIFLDLWILSRWYPAVRRVLRRIVGKTS